MLLFCMDMEVWVTEYVSYFGMGASTVAAVLRVLLPLFNLCFISQYCKRRRDNSIEFESTLGHWISHRTTSAKAVDAI